MTETDYWDRIIAIWAAGRYNLHFNDPGDHFSWDRISDQQKQPWLESAAHDIRSLELPQVELAMRWKLQNISDNTIYLMLKLAWDVRTYVERREKLLEQITDPVMRAHASNGDNC